MKRRSVAFLAAAVLTSAIAGCSGGGGGAGDGDEDQGWADRTNVQAIFVNNCSGCHDSQWASCWSVQEDAVTIKSLVSDGQMPASGVLAPSDKATLLEWIDDGAACSGTKPAQVPAGGISATPAAG